VKKIIESCGALVAVLPFRNDPSNSFTSKYVIDEIILAQNLGLPFLLFTENRVQLNPALTAAAVGGQAFKLPSAKDDVALSEPLALFDEEYHPSPRVAYAFLATSLRGQAPQTDRVLALVEYVTHMECFLGQRLQGKDAAQQEIVQLIRAAQFVIADITCNSLNTLIEAGVARGAGTRLHLICTIPQSGNQQTRFMFRDLVVGWYGNEVQRIAAIHSIAQRYRRRVCDPNI